MEPPTLPPDDRLDRTFSALAHPIRRAILSRLAQGEEASVTELAAPFPVSLMAVSKHLRVLEEAELVQTEKDGRIRRCTFRPDAMTDAGGWIERHRRFWAGQLDALAAYVEGGTAGSEPPVEREDA